MRLADRRGLVILFDYLVKNPELMGTKRPSVALEPVILLVVPIAYSCASVSLCKYCCQVFSLTHLRVWEYSSSKIEHPIQEDIVSPSKVWDTAPDIIDGSFVDALGDGRCFVGFGMGKSLRGAYEQQAECCEGDLHGGDGRMWTGGESKLRQSRASMGHYNTILTVDMSCPPLSHKLKRTACQRLTGEAPMKITVK